MEFQEWCPFLLCLEDTPHVHNICPDCDTVRYGNLGCFGCWQFWGFIRDMDPELPPGPDWNPFSAKIEIGGEENPQE